MLDSKKILTEVGSYYSSKLAQYGSTPLGVDWNGESGQFLRFQQLSKVIARSDATFSLNDLGCGYGALVDFLTLKYPDFRYFGFDVSLDMIRSAESRYEGHDNVEFAVGGEPAEVADYGIASGIFNVRMDNTDSEWLKYIEHTLDILNKTSRRGFSFNCLTSYSDPERMRANLYYADPCYLFNLCKLNYSKEVALLHDYELYEFTIIVRKEHD